MKYLAKAKVLIHLLLFYWFTIAESCEGPHEKRLLNHLLSSYNTLERPVANESEPLEVKFGLTLQQIIDVVSLQSTAKPQTYLYFVIELILCSGQSVCALWFNREVQFTGSLHLSSHFWLLLYISIQFKPKPASFESRFCATITRTQE